MPQVRITEESPVEIFGKLPEETQQALVRSYVTGERLVRTAMDVFRLLPEDCRAEVIDNILYMPPSPNEGHQRTSGSLFGELYIFFKESKNGVLYSVPLDVYLDETANAVQPDIMVILKGNTITINPRGHLHGVPDLIVEILSKGNQDHDLIRKKDLYERFGVKEYFVVEPERGLTLHYFLEDSKYRLVTEHIRKLESKLLNHTFSW